MSPSGQTLPTNENQRNKEQLRNNNNNPTILRRASLAEKCPKKDAFIQNDNPKKCNLPDVLPINATVSSRSIYDKDKLSYSPPNSPKLLSPLNYPIQKSISTENNRLTPKLTPENYPIQKSFSNDSMKSPVYINPPSPVKIDSPNPKSSENPHIYMNSPENSPKYINRSLPVTCEALPTYINPPSPTRYDGTIIQAVNPLYMNPPYINPPSVKTEADTRPQKSDASSQSNEVDLNKLNETDIYANSLVRSDSFTSQRDSFSCDPAFEGLQLIQRTEVTLRVNTMTSDAASQTEREEPQTPVPTRRKLQEEIECEKLSQDLVSYLSPSDRLKGILGELI